MATPAEPLSFGFLPFPKLTHSDLTGPREVFARMPGAWVHLIWKPLAAVASDSGTYPG
jgi:cyclohexyl-isocyanide hydratase